MLITVAFMACSKLDDQSLSSSEQANLKSLTTEACVPVSYHIWAGTIEEYFYAGSVTLSNDAEYLYLDLTSPAGFQTVSDNVDIGFYNELPSSRPDADALHYHYTIAGGALQTRVAIPLNDIFIEDLGSSVSKHCSENFYVIVHTEILYNNGTGISALSGWAGWNPGPDGVFWKWMIYDPCCIPVCDEETAWANGFRYINRGNWATYTAYSGAAKTEVLYAGQKMDAGTVYFTPAGDKVQIVIEFNEGWGLQEVKEAVKIQGYNQAPVNINPSPGLFTTYKGGELTVTVPRYNFYGVHVDAKYCK